MYFESPNSDKILSHEEIIKGIDYYNDKYDINMEYKKSHAGFKAAARDLSKSGDIGTEDRPKGSFLDGVYHSMPAVSWKGEDGKNNVVLMDSLGVRPNEYLKEVAKNNPDTNFYYNPFKRQKDSHSCKHDTALVLKNILRVKNLTQELTKGAKRHSDVSNLFQLDNTVLLNITAQTTSFFDGFEDEKQLPWSEKVKTVGDFKKKYFDEVTSSDGTVKHGNAYLEKKAEKIRQGKFDTGERER